MSDDAADDDEGMAGGDVTGREGAAVIKGGASSDLIDDDDDDEVGTETGTAGGAVEGIGVLGPPKMSSRFKRSPPPFIVDDVDEDALAPDADAVAAEDGDRMVDDDDAIGLSTMTVDLILLSVASSSTGMR